MRIEPVFDGELVIGKFYQVPTVDGLLGNRRDFYPVLGPAHEDKEIIGFPHLHYHYDFRFFNKPQWEYALIYARGGFPNGAVMSFNPDHPEETRMGPIIFRRRKCQRYYPEFPRHIAREGWLSALEKAYQSAVMKDLICPHRGASLRGLAVDEAGCVTCPLHGLTWNVKTGRLTEAHQ